MWHSHSIAKYYRRGKTVANIGELCKCPPKPPCKKAPTRLITRSVESQTDMAPLFNTRLKTRLAPLRDITNDSRAPSRIWRRQRIIACRVKNGQLRSSNWSPHSLPKLNRLIENERRTSRDFSDVDMEFNSAASTASTSLSSPEKKTTGPTWRSVWGSRESVRGKPPCRSGVSSTRNSGRGTVLKNEVIAVMTVLFGWFWCSSHSRRNRSSGCCWDSSEIAFLAARRLWS